MSELTDTIARINAPALRKKFYVALIFPLASEEEMLPHVPEHLEYMMAHEDEIFLSGPFVKTGRLVDEGMTVFHTESEEQAAEFMRNEPLTRRGLRRFELNSGTCAKGRFRFKSAPPRVRRRSDDCHGPNAVRSSMNPVRADVWKRWTAIGLTWAAFVGAAACTFAQQSLGQFFDPTGAAPERPASEPPAYNILRYEEDYSYLLDPSKRTDYLDPLKFIPLDADGRVYLTLGGDMRQRFEHYSGFGVGNGSVDGKADSYYLARYLLHADLHVGDALRFFFQLKSNTEEGRRDGARPNIDRDDFDVHQSFVDVTLPLGGGTDKTSLLVRLGRQELAYGDDRLIDIREGPNVRQSFDAARVSLQNPGFKVDALYARQVATNKGVFDDGYDLQQAQLWGVYSTLALPFLRRPDSADSPSIDLYYLGYDRQNGAFDQTANLTLPFSTPPQPGHETRHSLGGRLHGTVFPLGEGPLTGEFHYNVEGLYQFGRFGDANISAYEASFDLGYYFQRLPFGPNVSLRVDLASGDGNGHDRTLQTFNPLFPKGIYFSEPGLIGPSNILAVHPVVDWHLCKNVGLITTVIGYWRQDTGDGIYNFGGAPSLPGPPASAPAAGGGTFPGGSSRYVGTEANAWLEWGINRHLTFDLSYSHFFAGSYVRDAAASIQAPGGRGGQSFDYLATWLTYTF